LARGPATLSGEVEVILKVRQPVFVGCKMEGPLRRRLESLEGSQRQYVSEEDGAFLRICKLGDDAWVGKVVLDGLSTERVDDVRRNVLSILQRLCPDIRLPVQLEILPCDIADDPGREEAP